MRIIGAANSKSIKELGDPDVVAVFSKFAAMREKTGIAKIPLIESYIKEVTDNGKLPTVVFCYHRAVVKALHEKFPTWGMIIGGMTSSKRQDVVDAFQAGKLPGVISNIDAGGEAVTMTKASLLIITEPDWRARAIVQARKRIHRIGQDKPCSAIHLCAAESFDIYVARVSMSKMEGANDVLELQRNNPAEI